MPTTWQVKLINKKKFANAVLNENINIFVLYLALFTSKMTIHLAKKAQIVSPIAKKITILAKYSDYADVFLKKSAKMLL